MPSLHLRLHLHLGIQGPRGIRGQATWMPWHCSLRRCSPRSPNMPALEDLSAISSFAGQLLWNPVSLLFACYLLIFPASAPFLLSTFLSPLMCLSNPITFLVVGVPWLCVCVDNPQHRPAQGKQDSKQWGCFSSFRAGSYIVWNKTRPNIYFFYQSLQYSNSLNNLIWFVGFTCKKSRTLYF